MSQILISLIAFIVALGILVAVHEFGHFWVARKLGVKVLRFSVGFGKPIWSYRHSDDSTEYAVAAIPLGGYVKMLDEREGEVKPEERHMAFNTQPVGSRIAIVLAGPVFNFLLAIVLYSLVFALGITGIKPVVGEVAAGSPAEQAGFKSEETITMVQNKPVRTWQEVRLGVLDAAIEDNTISFEVLTPGGSEQRRLIQLAGIQLLKEQGDIIQKLGLQMWRPVLEPVIDKVVAGSAAEKYGLQPGDRILTANGQQISAWSEWVALAREHPLEKIELQLQRDDRLLTTVIVPDSKEENGKAIGFVGVSVKPPVDEPKDMRVLVQYSMLDSMWRGLTKSIDMTLLTFRMIGELIVGNASPRNISGPITIAEYAGKSASIDLSYFIDFVAIISISLAVLNILPIPLLDGGHLLYYLIEIIKGSPVSEKVQLVGQNIGIFILVCLMSLAFYNDITRLFQ